jgi:hypothetical protein
VSEHNWWVLGVSLYYLIGVSYSLWAFWLDQEMITVGDTLQSLSIGGLIGALVLAGSLLELVGVPELMDRPLIKKRQA